MVSSVAVSTTSPAKKPPAAPKIEPRRSATAISVTSSRSGVPPRIETELKIETWMIAALPRSDHPGLDLQLGLDPRRHARPAAGDADRRRASAWLDLRRGGRFLRRARRRHGDARDHRSHVPAPDPRRLLDGPLRGDDRPGQVACAAA